MVWCTCVAFPKPGRLFLCLFLFHFSTIEMVVKTKHASQGYIHVFLCLFSFPCSPPTGNKRTRCRQLVRGMTRQASNGADFVMHTVGPKTSRLARKPTLLVGDCILHANIAKKEDRNTRCTARAPWIELKSRLELGGHCDVLFAGVVPCFLSYFQLRKLRFSSFLACFLSYFHF